MNDRERGRISLEQNDTARASAQCFDRNGAGAGIGIEEHGSFDFGRQYIEKGFAQPIRGGANRKTGHCFEPAASKSSSNHSHRSAYLHKAVLALPVFLNVAGHVAQLIGRVRVGYQRLGFTARQFQNVCVAEQIRNM